MRALFWASLGLVGYTYVGFPILLLLRARLMPKPHREGATSLRVSMIIAAHNEEESIRAKVENALGLTPAPDEIVVGSDGSTDATNDIVANHPDPRVRLVACGRQGKPATLNAAVAAASGDVLVFSDANSMFDPDALDQLLRPFAGERVGGVAGDQRYASSGGANAGERAYWDVDRFLKRLESTAGSTVSATGSIYAIRRSLYRPIPDGVMDDFVISVRVVEQGYRLIFQPRAVSREPVAASLSEEFQRKVRIIMGGLYGVWKVRGLLDPARHRFYAIQLLTHKVLRRLVVVPLVSMFVSSLALCRTRPAYRWVAAIQSATYGLGVVGLLADRAGVRLPQLLSLPAFFVTVHWAVLVALARLLTGRRVNRWETLRRPTPELRHGEG